MTPRICLGMIVKDESHIIKDTLTHLLKYFKFSYWVISDTGSTDGTQQIIKDFFQEHNIPGELDETPWRDFGYNRTVVFEKAFGKSDYVFVWDADDEITGTFYLPEALNLDGYHFTFGNASGLRYKRLQLFKNTLRWKYEGVLHEYPVCTEQHGEYGYIVGDYYFISGRRGARSKDPNKYQKDAAILSKAFEESVAAGSPNTRYCFYTAQSYASANDTENAIVWYKKNLTLNGWNEEKYVSCLRLFEYCMNQKREAEAVFYCVESTQYVPDRLECIFELIRHYCVKKMPQVALVYYTLIQEYFETKYASDTIGRHLFARKEVGDFHLPYFMIIIGERTKQYDIAIKNALLLFKAKFTDISEWHIHNVLHNLQFLVEKLDPKNTEFLEALLEWRTVQAHRGISIKAEHNKIIESIIAKVRPALVAPHPTPLTATNGIFPRVLLSITTCKRLDLFQQTMNSLLRTWKDLFRIEYWLCVDDNSSEEDRKKMRELYPWFDFRMKTPDQRGHRESMNIIWDALKIIQPVFWIHLEDDWLFFKQENYVTRSIVTLDKYKDQNIHQVLFNRNYAELYADHGWSIQGGKPLDPYTLLHVKDMPVQGPNSCYWPHYSFRPSMVRVKQILELGNFDSSNTFFERDYANKWHGKGYQSAFFDTITCLHIGKLTSDKSGSNAYTLNSVNQFLSGKDELLRITPNIFVVNLKRRADRKAAVEETFAKHTIPPYEFFEAVDGKELQPTDELERLFAGNDFGNKRGVIGCALSHLALWKNLVKSKHEYYVIFEDDLRVSPTFSTDYRNASQWFGKYELLFLGYHIQKGHEAKLRESSTEPTALDRSTYIGGTFGYVINKKGAEKLLSYISTNGIRHGIDYLMKLVPNLEMVSYQPNLVFSDWMGNNPQMDSDIQKDHSALTFSVKSDDWVFVPGLDSPDNDLQCVGRKSHRDLLQLANARSDCQVFNTLGFLKSKVKFPLVTSGYLRDGDGVYVRKSSVEKEVLHTRQAKRDVYAKHDIIGLASRCDWFVYATGWINLTNTDMPSTIFLNTYLGGDTLTYFMANVYPNLKSQVNLIFAGDDFTFPTGNGDARENHYADKQHLIQTLFDDSKIEKIFVENLDTLHPKCIPIPLGILKNGQRGYHSDLGIPYNPIDFSKRKTFCMCIHRNRSGSQWELRKKVSESCKNSWLSFVTYYEGDSMNNTSIYEKMRESVFCLCVRGGGYDPSPKAWEALLNGCIPIVQHSPLDSAYEQLPVVFVNDWDEGTLNREFLETQLERLRPYYEKPALRLEVLHKLSLDYWWNQIQQRDKWVSCRMIGGLGNRLFQTAALLGFAEKYNYKPVFYTPAERPCIHQDKDNIYRCFPDLEKKLVASNPSKLQERDCDTHVYNAFQFDRSKDQILLEGYYQTWKYFPSKGISIPFEKVLGSTNYTSLLEKYGLNTEEQRLNTWFIHIRLGDYKQNNDLNYITVENYHAKLLEKIPAESSIILFSDEPLLALYQIRAHTGRDITVCEEKDELENLMLMSQCWRGAIVPNSTFSWWGAYLAHQSSTKPERFQAYYPTVWRLQHGEKSKDCIPPWGHAVGTQQLKRVKMLCNWCSSEQLCHDWEAMSKGNRTWNTIQITSEDTNIDYWVIINKPPAGAFYDPKRTIVFQMEPWCGESWQNWGVKTWGDWARPDPTKFLQVRTHENFYNNGFWQLSLTYSQLKALQPKKTMGNQISTICSTKYFDPGHKYRLDFLKYIESKNDPDVQFDFWNTDNKFGFKNFKGGLTPHKDKENGLVPYKYYFMCENNVEKNFITEKLWEPLLTETLVFYWGCPNVADYIDPCAYVQLDMIDFEGSFQLVKKAIQENWWEQRLPYIRIEKQKVLEYYQFFPTIERTISDNIYSSIFQDIQDPQKVCFIHSCTLPGIGTDRLDILVDSLKKSGLAETLDLIVIQNCGVPLAESKYRERLPNLKLIQWSDRTDLFELPTIRFVHWFSQRFTNTKLLYLHTKGISYRKESQLYKNSTDWIHMMLYFLVEQYNAAVPLLDSYDTIGCNYIEQPVPHWSGNFWWATTNYIRKLPTWNLVDKMDAERWIHCGKPSYKSLHQSGINHFQKNYPIQAYLRNKLTSSNTRLFLSYYHEDISKFTLDTRVVPTRIDPQTHFQEYYIYNLIDPSSIPDSIEYIGFICPKFEQKSRGQKLDALVYTANQNIIYAYNNPKWNYSYVDSGNHYHPNFKQIWNWLLEQLEIDHLTFKHSNIHIYSNMWLAPKEIALKYFEFAKQILQILDSAPPDIESLLKSDSNYNGTHPKENLIKMYGVPYYQYYPFIMERSICLFCDIHKIPVV